MGASEIIVAGGGEIYAQTIERAERLFITEVALDAKGETRFPPIDPRRWREVSREKGERGPQDEADFAFVEYERRRSAAPRRMDFMRGEFTTPDTSTRWTRRKSRTVLRRRMKLRLDANRPEQFGSPNH